MYCILCGRDCRDMYDLIRPGGISRCRDHVWKELGPRENFTPEEARQEGIKRVSILSPDEIRQEGQIAYAQLEKWEQELANPEVYGALRKYALDIIAAKKAYLSAFD